ncbi:MAG TPA: hypothetical protein ENK25_11275 [Bacteroidetes bacterium]|nr:hypothetical protein [Bacteroidota bacterium]
MKRNILFSILCAGILAGMIFTTGCGKKDTNPENHFTYNDTTYSLSQGFISSAQIYDSLYSHTVLILSDGFTVVWDANDPMAIDSITGKGNVLLFNLIGLSEDGLEDGTYEAALQTKKSLVLPNDKTWIYGSAYMDYTVIGDEESGSNVSLINGTVKVKSLGNNQYEFTFDVTSVDIIKLTGFFKGTFQSIKMNERKSYDTHSILNRL